MEEMKNTLYFPKNSLHEISSTQFRLFDEAFADEKLTVQSSLASKLPRFRTCTQAAEKAEGPSCKEPERENEMSLMKPKSNEIYASIPLHKQTPDCHKLCPEVTKSLKMILDNVKCSHSGKVLITNSPGRNSKIQNRNNISERGRSKSVNNGNDLNFNHNTTTDLEGPAIAITNKSSSDFLTRVGKSLTTIFFKPLQKKVRPTTEKVAAQLSRKKV